MAEEVITDEEQKPIVEPVATKRSAVVGRVKSMPGREELDDTDDEALFGAIEEDYNNASNKAKEYEDTDAKIVDLFNRDPRIGNLFVEVIKNGKNPLLYLIEQYGDDFKDALEDEELAQQLADANAKYLERQAKDKAMQAEAEQNLQQSLKNLDDAQAELGASDEDATAAFEAFANMMDDANVDKVSKETWMLFLKGNTYDSAVAKADREGEVRGTLNKFDQIKNKKTVPQDMPADLNAMNSAPAGQNNAPQLGGVLDKYGEDYKEWYDR